MIRSASGMSRARWDPVGVGVLVALAVLGFTTTPLAAQRGALPQELREIAHRLGCAEVEDFYRRPGVMHPPFVFGIDDGAEQRSAAFWCQAEGSRRFVLVVVRADGRQASLPWMNFPGGLSLTTKQDFDLSRFRLVEYPDSVGPRRKVRGVRAIRSYYDGVTELFVEYRGRWWVRMDD